MSMEADPNFGLLVPRQARGVSPEVLNPRGTWDDPSAYDNQARRLAGMFHENLKQFQDDTSPEVAAAGPCVG